MRHVAASALGRIGKDAVPSLINALKDENEQVRFYAAVALGLIGKDAKEAVSSLKVIAANDPAHAVKAVARQAVRKISAAERRGN